MPARFKRIAVGTAVVLVTALAATGATGPASADSACPGMTAPRNSNVVNQAPKPANDTASVLAGQVVPIRVLANDTDPDGDALAVVGVSSPRHGETCVSRAGTVQYYAPPSRRSYTQKLTYGVTDGDRYRSATITVSVEGIKPVQVTVTQTLKLKKHSNKVKTRARVAFKNLNKRSIVVLAGSPKKDRPSFTRTVAPGRTVVFSTKIRPRIVYVSVLRTDNIEDFGLVSIGRVNTRTGRHVLMVDADDFGDDSFRAKAGRSITLGNAWSLR